MAVAFRSQSTQAHSNATSTTITKPAGVVNGDVLVGLVLNTAGTGSAIVPPAGWTTLFEGRGCEVDTPSFNARVWVGYKVAASEGASWQWLFAFGHGHSAVLAYSGVHNVNPILDFRPSLNIFTSGGYVFDEPSQEVSLWDGFGSSGSVLMAVSESGVVTPSPTAPSGYTNRVGATSSGAIYATDRILGAAGAVAPGESGSTGTSSEKALYHILLQDAAVDPSIPTVRGFRSFEFESSTSMLASIPRAYSGDLMLAYISLRAESSPSITPPSGWTLLAGPTVGIGASTDTRSWVYYKTAGSSEPSRLTWGFSTSMNGYVSSIVTAKAASGAPSVFSSAGSANDAGSVATATGVTATQANTLLYALFGSAKGTAFPMSTPSGMTELLDKTTQEGALSLHQQLVPAGATGTRATNMSTTGTWTAHLVGLVPANEAPYAPTLVSPVGSVVIDRAVGQRFDWDFADPNVGDSQSKFDLDYRLVGAGSWTTVTTITPTTHHDFAPGFFAAGNYEWRVRTYDALGVVGPYSSTAFFTAANTPAPPTITFPANGATISQSFENFQWSTPDQEAFQVRKVADAAGAPDTGTVYYDSGTVVSGARFHVLTFPTNSRTEHLQVRVRNLGLWSTWSSILVNVNYTTPAVPTLVLTPVPAQGYMQVAITNPAPTGGQPALSHNDLYRNDEQEDGGTYVRIATGLPANYVYKDYTARSTFQHNYQVVAVGVNDTLGPSALYAGTLTLKGTWMHVIGDIEATIHQFIYNDNGGDDIWEAEHEYMDYVGRASPVMEYGTAESFIWTMNLVLEESRGDVEAMQTLSRAKRIMCVRDYKGRKIFTSLPVLPRNMDRWGARVQLSFRKLRHTEGVE